MEHRKPKTPLCWQSGGDYDLKWTAGSNAKTLQYSPVGVILCHLGVKYKSYCGDVGRTYLIDPPAEARARVQGSGLRVRDAGLRVEG